MDTSKIGCLIRALRVEKKMTQQQVADQMGISANAVSKWERGMGCPDVSLLPELTKILGIELETLLSGEMDANELVGGNMKKLKFYVCPDCGNIMTATGNASISCCGKRLEPLTLEKAEDGEKLTVETMDTELFITSEHPMLKDHYISFAALLTGDTLMLRKLYPEWNMQLRLPYMRHGMLVWYCTQHGLRYQWV